MATAQATIGELEEVYQQAEAALSDLTIERLQIPAKLVAAAGVSGDVDEIIRLEQRREQLPLFIRAATIVATRSRIALLRARHDAVEPDWASAKEELTAANAAYEAVSKRLVAAKSAFGQLDAQARNHSTSAADEERRLDDLLAAPYEDKGPAMHALNALNAGSKA